MTLVSIIMPAYNADHYIRNSIESILNQSFRDFEFIIINDGSTDMTASIIDLYAARDSRIRIIHQKNLGVIKSLNIGIKCARSDYIARMDADDISHPERLKLEYDFLSSHDGYVLVGSDYSIISKNGTRLATNVRPNEDEDLRTLMYVDSPFAHGSVMYKKSAFIEVGGYKESGKFAEDYDLWTRIISAGKVHIIPKVLFSWRLGDTNITTVKRRQVAKSARRIRARTNRTLPSIDLSVSKVHMKQRQYSKKRFKVLINAYTRICIYQLKHGHFLLGARNIIVLLRSCQTTRQAILNRFVEIITRGRKSLYYE